MEEKKENKIEHHEHKIEGHENKQETHEHKTESNSEKQVKKEIKKKEEAVAIANNAPLSKKQCMYICSFIKNKSIDTSISQLEEVLKFKRAIPFKGEIPHRHELGGKPGRYPINASKFFIQFLKTLKGNCIVNGLDLDKTRIYFASASWASRPAKRGGARFKRAYIVLKAKETKLNEVKK